MFKYPYVSCALLKRHATLPQLKKFDVTQKIVEALADVESRAIIFTMVNEAHQRLTLHLDFPET